MEALLEAIIEIVIEVFGELILNVISVVVGSLAHRLDKDNVSRKKLKMGIGIIFFGLTIALLIYSLCTKKSLYTYIVLIYMLLITMMSAVKFMNDAVIKNNILSKIVLWCKRIIHLAFPMVVIVFSFFWMDITLSSTIWIMVVATIVLFIYIFIYIFRIWRYRKNRR